MIFVAKLHVQIDVYPAVMQTEIRHSFFAVWNLVCRILVVVSDGGCLVRRRGPRGDVLDLATCQAGVLAQTCAQLLVSLVHIPGSGSSIGRSIAAAAAVAHGHGSK